MGRVEARGQILEGLNIKDLGLHFNSKERVVEGS